MGDRGQAAVEFMIVLALGLVILLPATVLFINYSASSGDDLKVGQIIRLGSDIVNRAETVYYYADPSRLEVQGVMPSEVKNITVIADWPNGVNLLVIDLQMGGHIQPMVFHSNVNINGSFEAKDMTPGRKNVLLEVKRVGNQPYVDIDFR